MQSTQRYLFTKHYSHNVLRCKLAIRFTGMEVGWNFPSISLKEAADTFLLMKEARESQAWLLVAIWLDFSLCFKMLASILKQGSAHCEETSMEEVRPAYNKPQARMKYHSQSFSQNINVSWMRLNPSFFIPIALFRLNSCLLPLPAHTTHMQTVFYNS